MENDILTIIYYCININYRMIVTISLLNREGGENMKSAYNYMDTHRPSNKITAKLEEITTWSILGLAIIYLLWATSPLCGYWLG